MENNIFENAYFSKPYRTRNNQKAIFQCSGVACACLFTEEHCRTYNFDGTVFGLHEPEYDIVSEWQVEINKAKLDKLAKEHLRKVYKEIRACHDDISTVDIDNAYKAGYEQAWEDKK